MNRDDIIRIARSVGIRIIDINSDTNAQTGSLVRFAQAIAAAEKEACAQVCDALPFLNGTQCATAIRMRGDVPESRQPSESEEGM